MDLWPLDGVGSVGGGAGKFGALDLRWRVLIGGFGREWIEGF